MSEKENCTGLRVREIYERMYIDSSCIQYPANLYESDITGKPIEKTEKTKSKSPNEIWMIKKDEDFKRFLNNLWLIEEFVAQVISSDKPAFEVKEIKLGIMVPKELPLSNYFFLVHDFASQYLPDYQYSAQVQLFIDCWMKLRLGEMDFYAPGGPTAWQGKKQFELFNDFLNLIRKESRTPEFKKNISRAKEKSSKRYRRSELYIDSLFKNRCTRLLVLRIDFSYGHECAKHTTVAQAKMDLAHFLNNKRGKPKLFKGWAGYIRKLEWGPEKGVHFHLIIFFKGSVRHKDGYLAESIGEYWKEITNKRGIYWNCNDKESKDNYKRLGIGMIEMDNKEKRKILLDDVVNYLAKTEQYLRAIQLSSAGDKLFVTGVMPRERTSTVGRPRKGTA